MVNLHLSSLQFFKQRVHKGLMCKYEGPFPIIARVDNANTQCVQLLTWFIVHNVFHANNLNAYHFDPQDQGTYEHIHPTQGCLTSHELKPFWRIVSGSFQTEQNKVVGKVA